MSKLRLGFSQLAASQVEQISEIMETQLSEQNERVNEMVWSSKCLLEAGLKVLFFYSVSTGRISLKTHIRKLQKQRLLN